TGESSTGSVSPLNQISPVERQNKGIITIYQEFNLLPNMTVAENMFLGREPRKRNLIVDEKAVNQEAQVILDYLLLGHAQAGDRGGRRNVQLQIVE
ncbi:D-xylose ABC transporter ATP-binding protein, partial (plasmid) [Enterobacter roggenkampii]